MKKKLHLASNKVVARQANSKIKEQRRNLIIDQIFQEAYSDLIKDPRYQGKTLDEMKNLMMHEESGNYLARVDRRLNGIAPALFNTNEAFEAPSENSVIIRSTEKVYGKKPNSKAEEIKGALSHSRADFFERISNGTNPIALPKAQTGTALMEGAVKENGFNVRLIQDLKRESTFNYQRISSSARQKVHEMDSAYEFFKKSGNVFAFDTETIGGENGDGISELLTIHDISYIHGNVQEGVNEVSFVRGLTDTEAEKMIKEMERIVATGDTSPKANVFRKAAIAYSGDIDEMTAATEDGLIRMIKPVKYDKNQVYAPEDFIKGIKNLNTIHNKYERSASGLTVYEEKIAEMMKFMNSEDYATLTYNGTQADMPWMNSFIYDTYHSLDSVGQKAFLEQAGLSELKNIKVAHNLDLMNVLREGSDSDLLKAIYSTNDLSARRMKDGHSSLSQEAIVNALLGDAGNAHTSLDDTRNLLKLTMNKFNLGDREESLLDYAMGIVKEKHGDAIGNVMEITPGQGDLFLATKGIGHNSGKGVLNFTYDPVANTFRTSSNFDIGAVGENGKNEVMRRSYGLNAVRKNQFVTVDDIYRLTPNSDNWDEIASQFSELKASELFVAKVTPHYTRGGKGVNIGMEQSSFIVSQTMDQLENSMSSAFARVGTHHNGVYELAEGVEDLIKTAMLNSDGEVISQTVDLGHAVAVSTNNMIADTTRRSIAPVTLAKYEKFTELDKLAGKVLGNEYQSNQAQALFNHLVLSNDAKNAYNLSKGEMVDAKNMLQEILTSKKMQTRNEVDNLKHAFGYFKEIQPIADIVNEQVTKQYGDPAARKTAFENVMNSILSTAAEELAGEENIEIRRAYLNNLADTQHMASKLNGFTFELPRLFREDNVWLDNPLSLTDSRESISFNLEGDSYGLRKSIIEKLNPGSKSKGEARAREEIIAMKSFMKSADTNSNYYGMFTDILEDQQALGDVDILANRIIERMREKRAADPTIGIRNDVLVQNIDKGHQGVKYIKNKYADDLSGFVAKHVKEAPRVDIINKDTGLSEDIITDLIDNYLIDLRINGEKYASAKDYINAIGHNGIEEKYFVENVAQTKQAYRSFLTQYVEGYSKGGGVEFVYDFNKHRLVAKTATDAPLNVTASLPRIVGRGTNIHAEQGNMKMAFRGILNMEEFVKGTTLNPDRVKVQSNITYALDHALKDMKYRLGSVQVDGEQMDGATYTLANIGKYMYGTKKNHKSGVTHISPTTGYSGKESLSFLQLDLRDAYSYMKEMSSMDVMKNQPFVNKEVLDLINSSKDFNITNMSHHQAQTLMKNTNHILQLAMEGNASVLEIIKALNPTTVKDTELNRGVQTVGGAHLRSMFGNKQSRPVPYTAILKRSKAETEKAVAELTKQGYQARIGNAFDLEVARKRSQVPVLGIGEVVENVTLSKANMSDYNYKAMLGAYLDTEAGEALPDAVVRKLQSVNLTEQEKVIDGRVADLLFRKQQIQRIGNPTQAPEFAESLENFRDSMYKITKNKDEKLEFKYSENGPLIRSKKVIGYKDGYNGIEAMTARFDGRMKYGVFSEGMLVPEDYLTNLIKDVSTPEEAMKLINQTFDDDDRFYLDRVGDVGFVKLLNGGVEKDMTYKMTLNAGSVDSDIDSFFNIIKGNTVEERLYNVDELRDTISTNYNTYKRARMEEIKKVTGKKVLSESDLGSILSKEALIEKAMEERYLATDAYQDMFKEMTGATQKVAITAAHEMDKHESRMMAIEEQVLTFQQQLVDSGQVGSFEEAAVVLRDQLKEYKVISNGTEDLKVEGSTIILPQNWNGVNEDGSLKAFNLNNFRQMVADKGYVEKDIATAGQLLKLKTNGETIGSLLMSSVSEPDDYQGISASQNFNLATKELDGEIAKYKTLANSVKETNPELANQYLSRIDQLEDQKRMIDNAAIAGQRGRSYGKRDIEMLNMQKYDESYNKTVKRAFMQGGNFQEDAYLRAMGNQLKTVNGQYVKDDLGNYILKDGSRSRAVLSGWTKEIKQNMVLGGPGDEILDSRSTRFSKRLNQLYSDSHTRNTIETLIRNDGAMSKEYAESMYSFMKGQEASRFNTGLVRRANPATGALEVVDIRDRSIASVAELEERGFMQMRLEDAIAAGSLDGRDVVDDPNSIFKKNIILDLGEEAGEETRYIAMPFVSNKATVADDVSDSHVIQKNFQKHMTTLKNRKQDILDLKREADGSNRNKKAIDKAVALYQDSADEMRRDIHMDVMGKKGVLGQLGVYRSEYSANVKTSSFVYMDDNMFGHIAYSEDKERVLAMTKSHFKDGSSNYAALKTATVDGMSLEQHYKEGRYYNTRFAGNQTFSEMGLFDSDFVHQQLEGYNFDNFYNAMNMDKDAIAAFEELSVDERNLRVLKHRLKTEGVMVDTVRYPTIKAGSTGPSMMYLDEDISGVMTKVGIEGQLGYTGDNDGDHVASNLIFRRMKGKDGKDVIKTSLNAGDNDSMFNAAMGYMNYRAAGANRYWRQEAEDIVYKSIKTANDNGNVNTMLKGDYLLNTYSGVASIDDVAAQKTKIGEFLDRINADTDSSFTISDIHDEKQLPIFDEYLGKITDADERAKYLSAYGFERQHGKMFMDMHAKDTLQYTGHINVPLFREREIMDLRMVADEAADTADQALLNSAFGTIEQKIISSKKIAYTDANTENFSTIENKIEKFTSALNNIYYDRERGTKDMYKWFADNKSDVGEGLLSNAVELMHTGNFDEELTNRYLGLREQIGAGFVEDSVKEQFKQTEEDIVTFMTDKVVDTLAGLNSDQRKGMKGRYALGVLTEYRDTANMQQIEHYLNDEGLLGAVLEKAQKAGADIKTVENYAFKTGRTNAFDIGVNEAAAFSPETRQAGKNVIKSTVEAVSNMKPSGLGIGALAVAASVLAVGAVGGNPSQATGMEAAEAAQVGMPDLDMMGEVPSQIAQTNTGYVINVRGRGNRSSINRASQQIARTMNGSFSNDVNINMNISEDSTIINDRFLEQIISDAIY